MQTLAFPRREFSPKIDRAVVPLCRCRAPVPPGVAWLPQGAALTAWLRIPPLHAEASDEDAAEIGLWACSMRQVKIFGTALSLMAIACTLAVASWVVLALLGF